MADVTNKLMVSHEHFRLKKYKYLRVFGTARHGVKEEEDA
jgi:hypothetical protein